MCVPERWFHEFCRFYHKAEVDPRGELELSGDPSKCSGWTAAMGVCLSRLAKAHNYWQDWEVTPKKIDFGWYQNRSTPPRVAIEHECWHTGVFGKRRRVLPKLVRSRSDLKVLITYGPGNPDDKWGKRLRKRIREKLPPSMTHPLLVVLADDYLNERECWYGLGWRGYVSWGKSHEWVCLENPLRGSASIYDGGS